MPHHVTLSRSEGLSHWAARCFATLSMTALTRLVLPRGVTLSRSEGSVALGSEMLRCAQHDRVVTHTASCYIA